MCRLKAVAEERRSKSGSETDGKGQLRKGKCESTKGALRELEATKRLRDCSHLSKPVSRRVCASLKQRKHKQRESRNSVEAALPGARLQLPRCRCSSLVPRASQGFLILELD